jgi:two-component system sensor histidine kinase YesM
MAGIAGRIHDYLNLFKIDKKLLLVCVLSLLVPITLSGIYFLTSFVKLTRENEFRQAQANVDRIENQLHEILGKAVDIANRIYVNSRIQEVVAAEYESTLDVYNAYNSINIFDDYLRSYREIAGIRLYVENPTMLDSSYLIVADEGIRREGWYETAKSQEGKMFWAYRRDPILRSEHLSLVRQVRNSASGRHVGVLCVNLDMGTLEQICAAELHDILISLNGSVICPANYNAVVLSAAGNWITSCTFAARQTVDSIFEITYIIPQKTLFAPVYSMVRRNLLIIFVSLAVSLVLILQIVNEVYVQKLQQERLFSRQKEMQLKILSNQINPHFLYNTLETIRMMALGKNEKEIAATIKMLSQILRQSLSAGEKTIPLTTELELVRNYLAIQKLRFGDRMTYTINMDSRSAGCNILPFLVQPLVENSLIHGLETKQGGGYIQITITAEEGRLVIDVTDNGTGMDGRQLEQLQGDLAAEKESSGVHLGLVNVNRRIKLFYGAGYGLTVSGGIDTGIQVRMVLPENLC